ncbi:MAG TPA: ATP-binding protein [Archangium sp.]|uniref:two-component system sensor histidine kinase NtrB n=1 Tax=Archangium sp. TaxID=1872627 RepID=UPI002E3732D3|nr:ATP-binding protein [Archangium sp.]HEX5753920.1 ATP-binding protein [Archangium sp.]
MAWLDSFLSEPLRGAAPSDLLRYRVLVGSTLFCLLFGVLNLFEGMLAPNTEVSRAPLLLTGLIVPGTLFLLRRKASPTAAIFFFCVSLTVGFVIIAILYGDPFASAHAVTTLLPAFAVYLMGPRLGLAITLFMAVMLGLIRPFLLTRTGVSVLTIPAELLWAMHIGAIIAVLGIWVLGTLHSTARDEIQLKLEQALKTLRDSERKLSSLFENTDDLVCSLDAEGRLLVANTAMKRAFARYFGKDLAPGQPLFAEVEPRVKEAWDERFRQVLQGQRLQFELEYTWDGAPVVQELSLGPIPGESGRPEGITLFARDITVRKQAEARLGEMHSTLVDVSRQAGMAEVATGVLHNVGNTLNSVNVSASLVTDGLRKLHVSGLAKAAALLHQHSAELPRFLAGDPLGKQLPEYLQALSQRLLQEQDSLVKEMSSLNEAVEHLKSIVNMQQKHARTVGTVEQVAVPRLIDEALRLHAVSFERLGIRLERDYAEVPPLVMDRHKLLQILINLLSNARHALVAGSRAEKRLCIRVRLAPGGQWLRIEVEDNGMGITPENQRRLFSQGFTTKKTGHGFGLHISALAATELKGRLSCTSPGPDQGATFTLELPLALQEASEPVGAAP